jgi:hypothetical protein
MNCTFVYVAPATLKSDTGMTYRVRGGRRQFERFNSVPIRGGQLPARDASSVSRAQWAVCLPSQPHIACLALSAVDRR